MFARHSRCVSIEIFKRGSRASLKTPSLLAIAAARSKLLTRHSRAWNLTARKWYGPPVPLYPTLSPQIPQFLKGSDFFGKLRLSTNTTSRAELYFVPDSLRRMTDTQAIVKVYLFTDLFIYLSLVWWTTNSFTTFTRTFVKLMSLFFIPDSIYVDERRYVRNVSHVPGRTSTLFFALFDTRETKVSLSQWLHLNGCVSR